MPPSEDFSSRVQTVQAPPPGPGQNPGATIMVPRLSAISSECANCAAVTETHSAFSLLAPTKSRRSMRQPPGAKRNSGGPDHIRWTPVTGGSTTGIALVKMSIVQDYQSDNHASPGTTIWQECRTHPSAESHPPATYHAYIIFLCADRC